MTLRKKSIAVLLALAAATLTSCLGDKETTELYSDTAVTSITLGTMNRYVSYVRKTTGVRDSLVKSTYTGSKYKINIDQNKRLIFNSTLLPYGTDLKHVLLTVYTKNNGVTLIKSITGDTLNYVTSTDSLDLSQPRVLRVISSDGEATRDYTLTLKADTVNSYSAFVWQNVTAWPETLVPQTDTLSISWPYSQAAGATYELRVLRKAVADSAYWRKITLADGTGDWTLIPQERENLYRLAPDSIKALVTATDTWSENVAVLAFLNDGTLRVSRDEGITWHSSGDYVLPDGFGTLLRVAQDEDGMVWIEDADHQLWQGYTR